MWRRLLALAFVIVVACGERRASAADAAASAGIAVVALPGSSDGAWPLAQAVYASTLRPRSLDDAHARVLCGEAAPRDAPRELRDLADTIAAVRGDDAPSRALLADVGRRFAVRALVVAAVEGGRASARVFLTDTATFDAARYFPDETATDPVASWSGAVASWVRAFGSEASLGTVAPPPAAAAPVAPAASHAAPSMATHEVPARDRSPAVHRAFYESGWFWGALAAAAVGAGIAYLVTQDSQPSTIHLVAEVPR